VLVHRQRREELHDLVVAHLQRMARLESHMATQARRQSLDMLVRRPYRDTRMGGDLAIARRLPRALQRHLDARQDQRLLPAETPS
jgi:hypothetical protein